MSLWQTTCSEQFAASLSLRSFSNSLSLFSIACRLFLQNTGVGWVFRMLVPGCRGWGILAAPDVQMRLLHPECYGTFGPFRPSDAAGVPGVGWLLPLLATRHCSFLCALCVALFLATRFLSRACHRRQVVTARPPRGFQWDRV